MATSQPSTGGLWPAIYSFNPLNVRKALFGSILVRDYAGSSTNLGFSVDGSGCYSTGFSPFAADGTLRSDLLTNFDGGGAFYDLGAGSDDGPSFENSTDVDKPTIWQSRRPVRSDVTKDEDTVSFTLRETTPLSDAFEMNLPLSTVAGLGASKYALQKPNETETIERQIIAIGVDGHSGSNHFFARIYPRVAVAKRGKVDWAAKKVVEHQMTWDTFICPFANYSLSIFRDGPAWRAMSGAPVFAGSPVATAVTGGKASIVFATPATDGPPFTYSVTQQVGGSGAYSASTIFGSPSVSGGNTTITVSGLTTSSTYKFIVSATGANSASGASGASNSITAIA